LVLLTNLTFSASTPAPEEPDVVTPVLAPVI